MPKLIDVDFPSQPQFVFGDLGCSPFRESEAFRTCYADVAPVYPQSQWPELAEAAKDSSLSKLVTRIYNQGNEGSCVANACSQAHEIVQAIQFGPANVVHLSAMSLYQRIGRSPNSGAMVSDGLEEMAERGILPLDTPENRVKFGDAVMPNTGWRNPKPANWEATAKNFRAVEWLIVDSVEELISALFNQHPVVVGRSGHSIVYCDPVYDGSSLLVRYCNSWGASFGEQGFGYDSLRLIRSSASWAFALRSVVVPE
jgi:hypothetical protein